MISYMELLQIITVVELFAGTEELPMTYTSPLITMANDERIKRFEQIVCGL